MDAGLVIVWSREALKMGLLLGGPPLLAALAVGLLVGVVQALTQMHEAAVAQVPRQVAVVVVVLALLPWLVGCWIGYASALIGSIPDRI